MKRLLSLLLILMPLFVSAQEMKQISGKVLSEKDGEVLIGASVYIDKSTIGTETNMKGIIENITLGTITDFDGNFTLEVPKGLNTIACSFLGFETQMVNITGKTVVTIKLSESTSELGEIIVTGYQKIEKRKLTGAVTTLDIEESKQAAVLGVDQMLEGQLAGVSVQSTGGAPGAPARIRIRGTASLNGPQDPLWVLDGIPLEGTDLPSDQDDIDVDQLTSSPIAGVNPDDIESITVLKDASATAIYGARAANGVIVITTKKGKKGKVRVNYSGTFSYKPKPNIDRLNLMNSSEKVDLELQLAKSGYSYKPNQGAIGRILSNHSALDLFKSGGLSAIPADAQSEISALRNVNANWNDQLYEDALSQNHHFSISGGTEKNDFYISAGYYNEKGNLSGTSVDRYNLSVKNNFKISSRFKAGVSLMVNRRINKSYLTDSRSFTNPVYYSRKANPYYLPADENNAYLYDKDINSTTGQLLDYNILEERENTGNKLKSDGVLANFNIEWKLTNAFTFESQLGLQIDKLANEKLAKQDSYYVRDMRYRSRYNGGKDFLLPKTGGIIRNYASDRFQYTLKNILKYSKNINGDHDVSFMLGNELRESSLKTIQSFGYGYDELNLTTQAIAYRDDKDYKTFPSYLAGDVKDRYVSFFGTGGYTYRDKYTVFGSVRWDGSNLFGVNRKYKYLPLWSIGGTWRIKEESFLKEVAFLNKLQLRTSYGLQGNIDKSTSPYVIGTYNRIKVLPGADENGLTVSSPPNPKLRWEKTSTYNLGLDFGFFKNTISGSIDGYVRKSSDLIGPKSLAYSTGFNVTSVNFAETTNKGVELSIYTRNIKSKDFSWSTQLNIAYNTSNVDKILNANNLLTPSVNQVGHPINSIFTLKQAGLDENGVPMIYKKNGDKIKLADAFQMEDTSIKGRQDLKALYESFGYVLTDEELLNIVPPTFTSKLTAAEQRELYTYSGSSNPKYSGGLTNKFTYKGFDLSLGVVFNLGHKVLAQPKYSMTNFDRGLNWNKSVLDRWTPENTEATLPRIVDGASKSDPLYSTYYLLATNPAIERLLSSNVRDASYARLQTVRLGYTCSNDFVRKLNLSGLRVFVEARNLAVLYGDYKDYLDPETIGNPLAQPLPKTVSFGVKANF